MSHVYALLNQKGGIGKTTASFQIAAGLKRRGYKVLAIDMDPQCNMTFSCGGDYQTKATIYDATFNEVDIKNTIQHLEEIDLVPGSNNMSSLEAQITREGREYFLRDLIEPLKTYYDYIVIDSPPALGLITISVMCAADSIIIPSILDMYSLQGIGQLNKTYNVVKEYCNPNLVIEGILITKDSRSLKSLFKEVADNANIKVFETTIPNSTIFAHSVFEQQSVFKFAPKSLPALQYDKFISELIQNQSTTAVNDYYRKQDSIKKHDVLQSMENQLWDELDAIFNEFGQEGGNRR